MTIEFIHKGKTLCSYSDYQGMAEIKATRELLAEEHKIKLNDIKVEVTK